MVPQPWPEPTAEVARAVRARFHGREMPLPVAVRDRFGELFADVEFASAFGVTGPLGWSPGRLALVTVFQMAENLTDRQAAEAVRDRLSWAYALGLDLADTGFDHTVLSEFRSRVVTHHLEEKVLDLLLARLKEMGLVEAGGKQRPDSTSVVAAVRDLNRLELVGESVRALMETLSAAAPSWLAQVEARITSSATAPWSCWGPGCVLLVADLVQLGEFLVGERESRAGDVLAQVRHRRGAGNEQDVR